MTWSPYEPSLMPEKSGLKILWVGGFILALGLVALVWGQIPKVYIAKPHHTVQQAWDWTPFHENGKFGYQDTDGRCKIAPKFDGADGFCEGLARVLVNGRFGFIDSTGVMVIPARFAWASAFRGGYASVWTGSDWDYLDKTGQATVIFPKQNKSSQARSL